MINFRLFTLTLFIFQILDANRDSPLISFTILIQHTNASTADALDIKVVDYTQNLAIYSSGVSPSGNIEANSNNLYIMTINAVIKRLRGRRFEL